MDDAEKLRRRVVALIEAGRGLNLDSPEAICVLESFRGWGDINTNGWPAWRRVIENLTISDLVLLIQMLTFLEREFYWPGGSVCSSIWLFRELSHREPKVAELLADWIVPRTNNDYLPFGSFINLRQWLVSRRPQRDLRPAFHSDRHHAAENERIRSARRVADLEHTREAEALAQRTEEAKAAYLAGTEPGDQFRATELLRQIAFDRKHKLDFFPKAWAKVSRDDLLHLEPATRAALLERLGNTRSVTWRRLYKRLVELGD